MAGPDNRAFHAAAVLLTAVAGVLGYLVTAPHPLALLFGVVAAATVLVPAELVFFLGERRRSRAKQSPVAPKAVEDGPFSLLGRALTAAHTLRADKELSDVLHQAVGVLRERTRENSAEVERLRAAVKSATEELERYAKDTNLDSLKVGQALKVELHTVKAAIVAVEQR